MAAIAGALVAVVVVMGVIVGVLVVRLSKAQQPSPSVPTVHVNVVVDKGVAGYMPLQQHGGGMEQRRRIKGGAPSAGVDSLFMSAGLQLSSRTTAASASSHSLGQRHNGRMLVGRSNPQWT